MWIKIDDKYIGEGQPCFIIAEAGVNHNGDFEIAKKMLDIAAEANVDAVKFQTFRAEDLILQDAPKAQYAIDPENKDESFHDLLKKLELPLDKLKDLKYYAESKGLVFLSTPFDRKSADFLDSLGVSAFKVSSTDFDNYPYLEYLLQKGKPLLISSGMADMAEVRDTMYFFNQNKFSKLVLFQCTSAYPTPLEYVNLRVIESYKREFPDLIIGFSDHSQGTLLGAIAVGLGANTVEKHFTLDKHLKGPDHKASLNPLELQEYVNNIRNAEKALGNDQKIVTEPEKEVKLVARKSIVTVKALPKGTVIRPEHITEKRPRTGIPAKDYSKILGKRLKHDIGSNSVIQWDDLE